MTRSLESPAGAGPSAREPLVVEVRRGGIVESRHRVHAVAVAGGEVVASFGRPGLVCFLRSAAKPLQALVLARALPGLDPAELAIACSSHGGSAEQVAAVERLLASAGADPLELECSTAPSAEGRLAHMCSGKHAGMLAACAARGWPRAGYRDPAHPLQRAIRAAVAEATGAAEDELAPAVDGCGVPTYAVELQRLARAYAALAGLDAGGRVLAAMRAHPELLAPPGDAGLRLMRAVPRWVAKTGVEGVLAAAGPGEIGIALKVEDGNARALAPACEAVLQELSVEPGEPLDVPLVDSRGARVGEVALA